MIDPAEARRRASAMISSSITLSFTGEQVGWMMYESTPAHVLANLAEGFAVAEPRHSNLAEGHFEDLRDLLSQRRIRVAREDADLLEHGVPPKIVTSGAVLQTDTVISRGNRPLGRGRTTSRPGGGVNVGMAPPLRGVLHLPQREPSALTPQRPPPGRGSRRNVKAPSDFTPMPSTTA